jgi:hypothetical protein
MSNGVTLITLFSLLMVGHFIPMGINLNDFFSPPMGGISNHFFLATNGGSLQMTFFSTTNGGSFQVIFSSFQWVVTSKGFSFPRVLFLHFSSS